MAQVKVHNPVGSTTKTLAVLAVLGVFIYDGVQLGVHHVNAQDTANEAAHAGEDVVFARGTVDQVCAAVVAYAAKNDATVKDGSCRVNPDLTVDAIIKAKAQTIVIGRFDKGLVSFEVKGHADKEG